MEAIEIINKYYKNSPKAKRILIKHSKSVAQFALQIARKQSSFDWDFDFIQNAAMLHDIGIIATNAPKLGCFGAKEYLEHGYIGAEMLKKEKLFEYAKIAERHTGSGITKKEIIKNNLPLPQRDMMPVSKYEKLICFADKFFSKSEQNIEKNKTITMITKELEHFGIKKVQLFYQYGKELNFF